MVNNTRMFVRLAMIGVLVAPVASQAEPIRCGTGLIQEGATALEIREKCGEPTTVERTSTPVYELLTDGTRYQVGVVPVDYWYFDFGTRQFPVRMTIKDGIAEKIELLTRRQ